MSNPYSPPETAALDAATVPRPWPIVAVLLSLLAGGAGYYYSGARWRVVAVAVLVPTLALGAAMSLHAGLPLWTLAPYPLVSLLVWIDTFRQARRPGARRPPWPEVIGATLLCFVYFTGFSTLYRAFVIAPFYVPAGSMAPALLAGDYFLSDKLAYVVGEPERGDIATFQFPDDPSVTYVKRVIGLPGDAVELTAEGRVAVNGVELPQANAGGYLLEGSEYLLLREETGPDRSNFILRQTTARFTPDPVQQFTVPAHAYFMLGDNRDNSKDSRRWIKSFVRRDQMGGRAIYMHWSMDPETGAPRFERIGAIGQRVELPSETPAASRP